MIRPLFIVTFEGLDKSGKASQSALLTQALRDCGLRVEASEFHRYDTPTGELVAKFLRGDYEADQYTIELLMAADKQAQQPWFDKLEGEVDVLVLDRYTGSQWAYAIAQGIEGDFADTLQRHMRQPDLTVLLDIPAELSMSRKGKHNGGENDRYESDRELLTNVRRVYRGSLNDTDLCINGDQPVATVHDEVLRFVQERLRQEGILPHPIEKGSAS